MCSCCYISLERTFRVIGANQCLNFIIEIFKNLENQFLFWFFTCP